MGKDKIKQAKEELQRVRKEARKEKKGMRKKARTQRVDAKHKKADDKAKAKVEKKEDKWSNLYAETYRNNLRNPNDETAVAKAEKAATLELLRVYSGSPKKLESKGKLTKLFTEATTSRAFKEPFAKAYLNIVEDMSLDQSLTEISAQLLKAAPTIQNNDGTQKYLTQKGDAGCLLKALTKHNSTASTNAKALINIEKLNDSIMSGVTRVAPTPPPRGR